MTEQGRSENCFPKRKLQDVEADWMRGGGDREARQAPRVLACVTARVMMPCLGKGPLLT